MDGPEPWFAAGVKVGVSGRLCHDDQDLATTSSTYLMVARNQERKHE